MNFARGDVLADPAIGVGMTVDIRPDANHAAVMISHVFVVPKFVGFEFVAVLFHFDATASDSVTRGDVNQVVKYHRGRNDGGAAASN